MFHWCVVGLIGPTEYIRYASRKFVDLVYGSTWHFCNTLSTWHFAPRSRPI